MHFTDFVDTVIHSELSYLIDYCSLFHFSFILYLYHISSPEA